MNRTFPAAHRELALFLDVDGTLLEVAPTPDSVEVPLQLPKLLFQISQRLEGALALISGRQLHELDRLFAPHRFCGAGAHGCELRAPGVRAEAARVDPRRIAAIHEGCRVLASRCAGVLVEYKGFGAAIHYRLAPDAEPVVATHAMKLLEEVGEGFELQPGKCVYEIKPAGFTKGTAIRTLMSVAPFATRRPVFIGDDATDEHGFEAVNTLGGVSIKVGQEGPTTALRRVASPSHVHRMLAQIHEAGFTAPTGAPDWAESPFTDRIAPS
jgi:trehalose 6-phosphate phosphatase